MDEQFTPQEAAAEHLLPSDRPDVIDLSWFMRAYNVKQDEMYEHLSHVFTGADPTCRLCEERRQEEERLGRWYNRARGRVSFWLCRLQLWVAP